MPQNQQLAPKPSLPALFAQNFIVIRHIIKTKQIQKNPKMALAIFQRLHPKYRSLFDQVRCHQRKPRVLHGIEHLVFVRKLLFGQSQKALIILAQKADINIVVPRDEPLVAHRADGRAPHAKIIEIMPIAKIDKIP